MVENRPEVNQSPTKRKIPDGLRRKIRTDLLKGRSARDKGLEESALNLRKTENESRRQEEEGLLVYRNFRAKQLLDTESETPEKWELKVSIAWLDLVLAKGQEERKAAAFELKSFFAQLSKAGQEYLEEEVDRTTTRATQIRDAVVPKKRLPDILQALKDK